MILYESSDLSYILIFFMTIRRAFPRSAGNLLIVSDIKFTLLLKDLTIFRSCFKISSSLLSETPNEHFQTPKLTVFHYIIVKLFTIFLTIMGGPMEDLIFLKMLRILKRADTKNPNNEFSGHL